MALHRKHTEIRQKQIIDAAKKLIMRYGSEHVTVRRIAGQIGITEAAIYRHFKSKREILSLLVDDIRQSWTNEVKQASSENIPFSDRLQSILLNRISVAEQKGGISFLIIAEILSLGDKGLNKQASDVVEAYIHDIAQIISEGIKQGELKPETDPASTALILYGMVQGVVNVWALSNRDFNLVERYSSCWQTFQKTNFQKIQEEFEHEYVTD
ncbi:MAG: TetR/AcrR family transcriptional regulator [Dehalococcoidales bacterium]|nr:TetR/AcrR family transcriptional regulator [Dehalococcoidales bacterium]